MFDKLDAVVKRFEVITERLNDPTLYDRPDELRTINQERSSIEPIVLKYQEYKKRKTGIADNRELLLTEKDEDMREMAKEELAELEAGMPALEQELKLLLIPKDPADEKT